MADLFNVFVIGPMGEDKDKPSEQSTRVSDHMENIADALKVLLPEYRTEGNFQVITPWNLGGADIEDDVFNKIDLAHLGVADITNRSPSVMYELAYFHALGTPVIVVDSSSKSEINKNPPFYLKGANIVYVDDFEFKTLKDALEKRLKLFFSADDVGNFIKNPISKFYGAPLVEIQGASTLAWGYYKSFVQPFISRGGGLQVLNDSYSLEKIYIVRPGDSLDEDGDFKVFDSVLSNLDRRGFKLYINGDEPKTRWVVEKSGMIFDLPRTLYNLAESPRLSRLIKHLDDVTGVSDNKKSEIRAGARSELVKAFFDGLERAKNSDKGASKDRMEIIDMAAIEGLI